MARALCLFAICVGTLTASAAEPASVQVERYLHEGRFAEGEVAMLLALDANKSDDEARFALGALQVIRAVENLGKALYEYGTISESAGQPFLRLPVPKNEKPLTISYQELGRVLDAFAADLGRAEETLAEIKDEDVKLKLRLNNVTFDFVGTGKGRKTLLDLLTGINGNRLDPNSNNLDFRFHFDRGDVAWLRAYCHFLCAIVDGYRAVDVADEFERRMNGIFPKVEVLNVGDAADSRKFLKLADAPRLRRMRLHLVKVCELNRETWTHIRKETDDDYEWLPHPKQTDQLGMPMTDQRIDAWLGMMEQLEGVLNGDRLIPGNIFIAIYRDHPVGQGVNLKKLLDDPRPDLFNWDRVEAEGIDAKYLEPENGKPLFEITAILAVFRMFGGPLGFAHAARLN